MGTRKGDRKRVSGKEGAMVFRMLKGFRRLMLTTAMLFGVGLFLCGNEVKAAVTAKLEAGAGEGDFKVTVASDNASDDIGAITNIKLYKSGTTLIYELNNTDGIFSVTPGESNSYTISASDFIEGTGVAANYTAGNAISIDKVEATYKRPTAGDTATATEASISPTVNSKPIYKVEVANAGTYSSVKYTPTFTNITVGGKSRAYGYEGESFTVVPEKTDFDINYYYDLVYPSASFPASPSSNDSKWKSAGSITGTLSTPQANNEYKVAYLPKIKKVELVSATNGTLDKTEGAEKLNVTTGGTADVTSTVDYKIVSFEESDETLTPATAIQYYYVKPVLNSVGTFAKLEAAMATTTITNDSVKLTMALRDTNTSGASTVAINIGVSDDEHYICDKYINLAINLGIKPTGFVLQNTPITVTAGSDYKTVPVVKNITPLGANQTLASYAGTATVTSGATLIDLDPTYDATTGSIKVKAKSGVTSGTAKVKLELTDPNDGTNKFSQTFDVTIVSLDAAKTKDSINNSERNFITVDHKLDLEALIKDYVKDSSGGNLNMAPKSVRITTGSDYAELDGMKLKGKKAGTVKVSAWFSSTTASGRADVEEIEIGVFPNITAEYLDSSRTVKVKIPRRVATSYKDSKTISEAKGFTLVLEDSSGNTLYEYDKTKFQDVISNSSDDSKEYTISASDIESMVTNAASNGKFNNDTTSVKFRVVPRGYKPPKSDKDMTTADKDVNDSCSATVYRVTASGTNFGTTYAYGLSGQNVTLTASPNAGFTFKQWSDGNTSNPRTVTVSSSGTRTFSAVAGERLPNGGSDNSELYDDVPKTAESNSAIWLIVFMVFAVIGTTYALYLQLRAATSKNDK